MTPGHNPPAASIAGLLLWCAGCASFDPAELPIDPPTVIQFVGGTFAQIAFHEAAHAAYAEYDDIDYFSRIDGISFKYAYHTTHREELARVARMGYLADTATAETVPWIPAWRRNPFLNGLYFGSILDRGKAAVEGEGDVPLIADTGGPSERTLRALFAAGVTADVLRWRWPNDRWIVTVSAGLHGAVLFSLGRPF